MRTVCYASMVVAAGLIGSAEASEKLPHRVLAAAVDRDGTVRIDGRTSEAASPQFIGAAIPRRRQLRAYAGRGWHMRLRQGSLPVGG